MPSAIVRACLFGLAEPANSRVDPGKCHLKLGLAYSNAGDPRSAIFSYATAQMHLGPNTNMHLLCTIESSRESLKLDGCDLSKVEADLVRVVSKLVGVQEDVRSALLVAECCVLLGDIKLRKGNTTSARIWMIRAVSIQSDVGMPSSLCASLRSLADVLRAEERYSEARHMLLQVETLQAQHESDHCVKILFILVTKTFVRSDSFFLGITVVITMPVKYMTHTTFP